MIYGKLLKVTHNKNAALYLTAMHHKCIDCDLQLLLYDFITHKVFLKSKYISIHKINNLIEPFKTNINNIDFSRKINHILFCVKHGSVNMVIMEYITTTTNNTTITKAFSKYIKDYNFAASQREDMKEDGYKSWLSFKESKQKYFSFYEFDYNLIKVKIIIIVRNLFDL